MQKAVPDLKAKCLLSNDIYDYHYVSQGKTSVPSIDDNEDLEFTHEAFNILHFTEEETYNIYKCVYIVVIVVLCITRYISILLYVAYYIG